MLVLMYLRRYMTQPTSRCQAALVDRVGVEERRLFRFEGPTSTSSLRKQESVTEPVSIIILLISSILLSIHVQRRAHSGQHAYR